MYKKEFDKILASDTLLRCVLLYGEESFLLSYYAERIAQKSPQKEAQKNQYYFGEYDFPAIISHFSQGSLFGDENLVILKTDQKIPKKQLDTIVKTLISNQNGYFILEFHKNENKTASQYAQDCKALAASFKAKDCFEVRFFPLNIKESLEILQQYAKKFNINITEFLLRKILEQQNFDLGLSLAELQKYSIFEEEIQAQTIDFLGYGLGSVEYEEILELLLNKRDFYPLLRQFIEQGFDEIELINEVQRYFYQLFLFASHIKINGDANSQEVLGYNLPQEILNKKKHFAILIRQEQYAKIFYILEKWREETFKGISKGNGFLSTLIKIQELLR